MKVEKASPAHTDSSGRARLAAVRKGPADDPECLTMTVEQAARKLGISRAHAYTEAMAGRLPTIRLGHRFVVPKAAFEKLFAC